jgi:hypothetical protein
MLSFNHGLQAVTSDPDDGTEMVPEMLVILTNGHG